VSEYVTQWRYVPCSSIVRAKDGTLWRMDRYEPQGTMPAHILLVNQEDQWIWVQRPPDDDVTVVARFEASNLGRPASAVIAEYLVAEHLGGTVVREEVTP
jgi:hypothetical protein